MKKLVLLIALSLLSVTAASAQTAVVPYGKNLTNSYSPANPSPCELDTGGLVTSAANPQPVQMSVGGAVLSDTNTLPCRLSTGATALNGLAAKAANALPVSLGAGSVSTYMASTSYAAPVATPTDILGIVGSASKTVKILKITVSGTQTTAGVNQFFLIKRSTADTGSTPVAATLIPCDSANSAATAVVQRYTSTNPSTGSAVGTVLTSSAITPAPGATGVSGNSVLFDAKETGQPIVLNGIAQELDINFAGAAVPSGMSLAFSVIFTEE